MRYPCFYSQFKFWFLFLNDLRINSAETMKESLHYLIVVSIKMACGFIIQRQWRKVYTIPLQFLYKSDLRINTAETMKESLHYFNCGFNNNDMQIYAREKENKNRTQTHKTTISSSLLLRYRFKERISL